MQNEQQSILITGASSGIGMACALHFDRKGYQVFAGVRSKAAAQALQEQATGSLIPLILDVTDHQHIETAKEFVLSRVGKNGLSGLVNNAGIALLGPLEFLPIQQVRQQFEVNVIGLLAVTQAFTELVRQNKPGRIINIGSSSGLMAEPFLGAYAASKFALEGLTDSLRFEMQLSGIQVSLIQPGAIATPIWDKTEAEVKQLSDGFSERATVLYVEVLDRFFAAGESLTEQALPPEKIAQTVEEALTSIKPKSRYLVGRDAFWMAQMARWLPDKLRDWLIRRDIGI